MTNLFPPVAATATTVRAEGRATAAGKHAAKGRSLSRSAAVVLVPALSGGLALTSAQPVAAAPGAAPVRVATAAVSAAGALAQVPARPARGRPTTLRYKMRGGLVKQLQARLGVGPRSGWFGPRTLRAVRSYQKRHGLQVTGMVSPQLRRKLGIKPVPPRASRSGARARAGAWAKPMTRYRLSSGFGWRWARMHKGLDFAAPRGTGVRSVAAGRIKSAGWENGFGWTVRVRHAGGVETLYAHLSRIDKRRGTVRAGTPIGGVGSSGRSTGNHLHLEVRLPGRGAVSPYPFLKARGVRL